MGKSKLEKVTDVLGVFATGFMLAALVLVCVTLVLGCAVLVGQINEAEHDCQEQLLAEAESMGTAWIVDDHDQHDDKTIGNEVLPAPTVEPVSDALAVATMKDYANQEASRIAKMAAILMGIGGEYIARCDAVYNAITEKVETEYSIAWQRPREDSGKTFIAGEIKPPAKGKEAIIRTWTGRSWAECIAKMSAWKGGE